MKPGYASPNALRSALSNRARVDARTLSVPAGDLVERYVLQRLLARVFQEPAGWLLKGGQALLVRYPAQARNSRDIDLFDPAHDDIEEAVEALLKAAAIDLEDHFRFTFAGRAAGKAATTIRFASAIGDIPMQPVSVDVVVRRAPTSVPSRAPLTPAVSLTWPDSWPQVLLYPLADHVADKICGMYEWHNGKPSTRVRDLADLLLISQREQVVGRDVQAALLSERVRRPAVGIDLRLPAAFTVPDPRAWPAAYAKAAKKVIGLSGCTTLHDAEAAAGLFLTPLLDAADPGTWDPGPARWRV